METLTPKTTENLPNELFIPDDVRQLLKKVATLPPQEQEYLQDVLAAVVHGTQRRHEVLHLVQEAVSQLRLDMKYLVFDLEATRKERDAYLS